MGLKVQLVKIIDNTNFLSHTYCTDCKNDHPWLESPKLDKHRPITFGIGFPFN